LPQGNASEHITLRDTALFLAWRSLVKLTVKQRCFRTEFAERKRRKLPRRQLILRSEDVVDGR
jgi:hypothetical protein